MDDKITNSIRILTRAYYDAQRDRTRLDGQLGVKKSGDIKKNTPDRDDTLIMSVLERREYMHSYEKQLEKDLAKEVHKHQLWKGFLVDVKGCGEGMAAVIISEFDIEKSKAVSNMWSFAGLAPGKDRLVKGQKCCFNQFLRSKLCGVLGGSFLKSKAPYSELYYNMKTRLEGEDWGMESKNPTDKKRPKAGHQHNASIRYMIKMFLKDLYVAWRSIEGLSVRKPYQEEYLGHKHTA